MQEILVHFLGQKDPLEKVLATHSSILGLPCGLDGKESACDVGDLGLVPGLGRSPGGEHSNHSSILTWRIPTNRGAWQAAGHRVTYHLL